MSVFSSLLEPEGQADPHHWAATFCAHCWLAIGLWGAISIGWSMWNAAWLVPLLYLLIWEIGIQIASTERRVTRALIWDCILDTTAIGFGCYAAACLGNGLKFPAMMCWGASFIVGAVGWRARARR